MRQRYEHRELVWQFGVLRQADTERKALSELSRKLKELEQEGWELIQVLRLEDGVRVYFKRFVDRQ